MGENIGIEKGFKVTLGLCTLMEKGWVGMGDASKSIYKNVSFRLISK
jgi:hypothetical protein